MASRIRRPGGGRKLLEVTDSGLWDALDMHDRPGDARRSGIAVALDLQEHAALAEELTSSETIPSVIAPLRRC